MDIQPKSPEDKKASPLLKLPVELLDKITQPCLGRIITIQIRHAQTPRSNLSGSSHLYRHLSPQLNSRKLRQKKKNKKLQAQNKRLMRAPPLLSSPINRPVYISATTKGIYELYNSQYLKVESTVSGVRFFFNWRSDTLYFDSRDAIQVWNENIDSLICLPIPLIEGGRWTPLHPRDMNVKHLAIRYSNAMTKKEVGLESTLRLLADLGTVNELTFVRDRARYSRRLTRILGKKIEEAWNDAGFAMKRSWNQPIVRIVTWDELRGGHDSN
ncbi:hypothetical protein BKA64DRAFT_666116 [Cadophora sp. MPI-SDFR-AT-0126]|nr:hypothetical protein BKA64DRAFT_666116 [Leotiomycetes sp. MPI-SDFR-AT-0126]